MDTSSAANVRSSVLHSQSLAINIRRALVDWHHKRQEIRELLELHPIIDAYVSTYYAHVLRVPRKQTVSLHLRLGYAGEPSQDLLDYRTKPSWQWYMHVMMRVFEPEDVHYVVLADDADQAEQRMLPMRAHGISYTVVHDNVVVCLHLMTLCTHHVLSSSTLSFWGAYLDR
jgi:hypothetical protein